MSAVELIGIESVALRRLKFQKANLLHVSVGLAGVCREAHCEGLSIMHI